MKSILFIIFTIFIFTEIAEAHKVNVYAYREGDRVIGECYFVDGLPCKGSKVEVYDLKGIKIIETLTDERGKFSFTTSESVTIRIVVFAGEGHRAEYILEAFEGKSIESKSKGKESDRTQKRIETKVSQVPINREEIKQIIEDVMEVKIQGLRSEIMDLHKKMDRVNFREIIGGIGYIFGIWGLIMLLKRRKNES